MCGGGGSKVRGRSLHSVMGLAILQRLPLLLRFVLQVVSLLKVAEHQAVEDVLVGLLDQLLKQPQRHDADLGGGQRGRNKAQLPPQAHRGESRIYSLTEKEAAAV